MNRFRKVDLTKTGLKIEREDKDKSGHTFIILGNEKSNLVITVREQKNDDFFMIDLCEREKANKKVDRYIESR